MLFRVRLYIDYLLLAGWLHVHQHHGLAVICSLLLTNVQSFNPDRDNPIPGVLVLVLFRA